MFMYISAIYKIFVCWYHFLQNGVTEEMLSVSDINPRKRKWSEVEETTLIECVIEREGDQCGDTKGIRLKKKSAVRRESWEDICDFMNS